MTLTSLLVHAGYDVRCVENGRSALEVAYEFRPHAGIFDIGMPGLTGYELAAYIRQEPWGRAILLIALSGWGEEVDRLFAYGAGFTHHVTKPAEFEHVAALLCRGLAPRLPAPVPIGSTLGALAKRALDAVIS